MPYNPGSAYPRKTVYVPPTYGDTSFQRATNSPDFSSTASSGSGAIASRGRAMFAGAAASAAGASSHPEAGNAFGAMQRKGIVGDLQSRYMEQRGLRQNQGGAAKPDEVKTPAEMARAGAPTHGNPAAQQKQAAATQLADGMVGDVLTGDMPGDTGRANTRKSKKTNPNQTTLF